MLANPSTEVAETDSASVEKSQAQAWNVQRLSNIPGYQTTLSLTRNPTIPVIYFSCFLMVLGVLISFLPRRAEVWFSIHPDQRKSLLVG